MSDLVKRLRDKRTTVAWFPESAEAADRIEQLERELAKEKAKIEWVDKWHAEKALADRLGKIVVEDFPDGAAAYDYRKARGL